MIRTVITCILALFSGGLFAQDSVDTWTAFDTIAGDLTYTGFKDNRGVVKIPPVFTGRTVARKFDNIICAMEFVSNRYTDPVYITKTGAVIKDSIYMLDYTFDCESEGHIRYKDPETGNVGMFNGNGKVVVPAIYNDLSRVYNGMMVGLKGAEKETTAGSFFWKGGKKQLLNTNNKVLVDSLDNSGHLNFYSLKVSNTKGSDSARRYFKGQDGKYYSFTDFEEDLKAWVSNDLLKELTEECLILNTFDTIKYSDFGKEKEWVLEDKNSFINRNFENVKRGLADLGTNPKNYMVTTEIIVKHIFEPESYSEYYNNCNEIKYWQYPVMSITTRTGRANADAPRFYFLYTPNGYKLIGVQQQHNSLK
ncbi:hypothetical protein GR160_17650 [Flavobacterium sp. Sd200]|uniref:hypothetical protein n=1 Tax=Flavobacterium sp. Sd200 TaxID=2692211 RepID=UPI00136E6D7D|nr:hypothetical protein [Flavobacterium sp. Sd200]MXN93054.1 hypothetical protein [Flavobacterium sp. Sd200]